MTTCTRKRARLNSSDQETPPKKKLKIDEEALGNMKIQHLRQFIRQHGKRPKGSEKKGLLKMAKELLNSSSSRDKKKITGVTIFGTMPTHSLRHPLFMDEDLEVCTIFKNHLKYHTDVEIHGNGFLIFVHGAILAQGSPSFCALLNLNNPGALEKNYLLDSSISFKSAVNFFKNFYVGLKPEVSDMTVKELAGYAVLIDMHFLEPAKKLFKEDLMDYLKKVRTDVYPDGFKYDAYRTLTSMRKDELGTLFDLSIHYKVTHRHSLFTLLRHEFERTQNTIPFEKVKYVLDLIDADHKPVFGDNLTTWLLSYASHQKMRWDEVHQYFQKPKFDSLTYLILWVASTSAETGWRQEKRRDRCELFIDAAASYFKTS